MRAFINRHMGVPEPVAAVVTGNVAQSLRNYFLGVTIIAAFNAVVVGLAALIAACRSRGRSPSSRSWVPTSRIVGAWVAGAFAVLIALGTVGADAAVVMAVAHCWATVCSSS